MFDNEDAPKKKLVFEIGQNLEDLSVEELGETIKLLEEEIARLDAMKKSKSDHLSAASALFSKPS